MLRWLVLALAVIAISVAATVVVNYLPTSPESPGELKYPVARSSDGLAPRLVVEADESFRYRPTGGGGIEAKPPEAKKPAEPPKREAKGHVEQRKGQTVLQFGAMSQLQ